MLDETADSFKCNCKSPECRKVVKGIRGNSITVREMDLVKPKIKKEEISSMEKPEKLNRAEGYMSRGMQ